MHTWLNLLLQKGSRRVQLLFRWYIFFGFQVNRLTVNEFSKTWIIQHLFHHKMHLQQMKRFSALQATKKIYSGRPKKHISSSPSENIPNLVDLPAPLPPPPPHTHTHLTPFSGRHICMIPERFEKIVKAKAMWTGKQ